MQYKFAVNIWTLSRCGRQEQFLLFDMLSDREKSQIDFFPPTFLHTVATCSVLPSTMYKYHESMKLPHPHVRL